MKDGNEMDSKRDKIVTDAEKLVAEVQSETYKQEDCKVPNNLDSVKVENNDEKQANYLTTQSNINFCSTPKLH